MEVQPIRNKKQLDKMKEYLAGNDRNYLLFTLGVNTGMRVGDILSLTIDQLITEQNKPHPFVMIKEEKTDKYQRYSIEAPNVQKAIKSYLGNYKGDRSRPAFHGRERGGIEPITRQLVWQVLKRAAKKAGIVENIGSHTMRKTFGYHAYKGGANIALLMELFNHSSQRVTLRYIGITQEEKDKVRFEMNL